ncbi:MAG: class I SAM-dependent methyltransferase [Chloroflexi bacterium]|nr:class I SAM-dependent methyltransferase [Chloroflexota bacterium]MCC6892194.1 methyltransferase domain-containing protein [Anaerolineae bacterium]
MSCPHCKGAEKVFDASTARGDLEDYRRNGPAKTTRLLLDAIRSAAKSGLTLIDIGGGVGAIQHELFKDRVQSAVHVDASTAYLGASQEEASTRGHRDRVRYVHGNFVELAPEIAEADIVTLDRVLCCYPDMPALVKASASHARQVYGVVYPRDTWWMRLAGRMLNGWFWIRRNPFRFFVHPAASVDNAIRANGFTPRFHRNSGMWQIVVYGR